MWLARLHSERCTKQDRRAYLKWLSADERHRQAYEIVSGIWETSGGLKTRTPLALYAGRHPAPAPSHAITRRAVVAGAAASAAAGLYYFRFPAASAQTYRTGFGELRTIAMADGSQAVMDTETEIRIRLDAERRAIEHLKGRVYYDVAAAAHRPFEVSTPKCSVRAASGSFEVEQSDTDVKILRVSGQIAVETEGRSLAMTEPGEQFVFSRDAFARSVLDPAVATAWRHGRLVFEDRTIAEAIAGMNRYSRRQIVIGDPEIAGMRISGTYRTGANDAFAATLTTFLPIATVSEPSHVVLVLSSRQPL